MNINTDYNRITRCEDKSYTSETINIKNDPSFKAISETLGPMGQLNIDKKEDDKLLERFIEGYGSQLAGIIAYNNWITTKVPEKIESTVLDFGNQVLTFKDVKIVKPCTMKLSRSKKEFRKTMTPCIARNQNDSYLCNVIATVVSTISGKEEHMNVDIGQIPCMLGSAACHIDGMTDGEISAISEYPSDAFGYFIIKGSEKVIRIKERIRYNMFNTFKESDSNPYVTRITNKNIYANGTTVIVTKFNSKTNHLETRLQNFTQNTFMNTFIIFKMLGLEYKEAQKSILKFVPKEHHEKINNSLVQSIVDINSLDDDKLFAVFRAHRDKKNSDDTDEKIKEITEIDVFSNTKSLDKKISMLSIMCARTLMYTNGLVAEDCRDSWANKKFQMPSDFLDSVFNNFWGKFQKDLNDEFSSGTGSKIAESNITIKLEGKLLKNMYVFFSPNIRTNQLNAKGGDSIPATEQLKRVTLPDSISMTTKTCTPTATESSNPELRIVQASQAGYICPAETPDGNKIGINKHMSLLCWVSINRTVDLDSIKLPKGEFPFIVNGVYHSNVSENSFVLLKKMKQDGRLPFDSCVHYNEPHRTFEIYTEDTRPTRPLLVVMNNELVIDTKNLWEAPIDVLIKEGCVEFIDSKEQEYIMIATSIHKVRDRYGELQDPNSEAHKRMPFTHSEINGNAIFSFSTSTIPWANKDKAPRIVYQAGMTKQATHEYHSHYWTRYDTSFKRLVYTQRPICESNTSQVMGLDTSPNGNNVMVSLIVNENNNEDAIVMKKEMLEGEYFTIGKYVSHKLSIQIMRTTKELFARSKATRENEAQKYSKLDEGGFPILDSKIKKNNAIIGKLKSPSNANIEKNDSGDYITTDGDVPVDASKIASLDDEGYVERVLITNSPDNMKTCRVLVGKVRRCIEGDKFACRYSQKGTCGKVLPRVDMPMILGGPNDGVVPDILVSPCSVPSRMTISMLLEQIGSKAALYTNGKVDATTFVRDDPKLHSKILEEVGEKYGYKEEDLENFSKGLEYMIRPNGKAFKGSGWVSCGVICYQALRHHVLEKTQSRSTGPINAVTRQGMGGRRGGQALRFGEQDTTATISNGNSSMLLERLMEVSDKYTDIICKECGSPAILNLTLGTIRCTINGAHSAFGKTDIPYILLLLSHHLNAAGVKINFGVEDEE